MMPSLPVQNGNRLQKRNSKQQQICHFVNMTQIWVFSWAAKINDITGWFSQSKRSQLNDRAFLTPFFLVHFRPDSIGGTKLDSIIWSLVDTHQSSIFGLGLNQIRLQHFYMILCEMLQFNLLETKTRYCTLVCVNQ